ncbi:MAG: hypothetical protein BZY82_06915 [SAR202 cluster bacterium Io17-Chloro-G3]|nr:MAG: hypothetical protein BZY82_06915 [SAR202 cluster bacterium Io17-Chloro-G3]
MTLKESSSESESTAVAATDRSTQFKHLSTVKAQNTLPVIGLQVKSDLEISSNRITGRPIPK